MPSVTFDAKQDCIYPHTNGAAWKKKCFHGLRTILPILQIEIIEIGIYRMCSSEEAIWAREVHDIRILIRPEIHQMHQLITQIPPRAKKACHKICTNKKFALLHPRLLAKKDRKGGLHAVSSDFQIGTDPTAARRCAATGSYKSK